MTNGREVLALIPARGGSKSIPGKNIVLLEGLPLIAYSILAAEQSETVSRIVVSTDDLEIAEVGRRFGAEVPFMRPASLAGDATPSIAVVRHALDILKKEEGYQPDVLVLLQPTSPLRSSEDIDAAVEKLLDSGCDSVVSVTAAGQHPYWMYTLQGDRLLPLNDEGIGVMRRQDLPDVYCLNGAVYATRPGVIYEHDSLKGPDTRALVMPADRSVDIDEPLDLLVAAALLQVRRRGDK